MHDGVSKANQVSRIAPEWGSERPLGPTARRHQLHSHPGCEDEEDRSIPVHQRHQRRPLFCIMELFLYVEFIFVYSVHPWSTLKWKGCFRKKGHRNGFLTSHSDPQKSLHRIVLLYLNCAATALLNWLHKNNYRGWMKAANQNRSTRELCWKFSTFRNQTSEYTENCVSFLIISILRKNWRRMTQ